MFCYRVSKHKTVLYVGAANSVGGGGDKNWRNRRSQKLDKMELLNLQSSLQSEIQAKQTISEDLSKTRAELLAAQKYICFFFLFNLCVGVCNENIFLESCVIVGSVTTLW